MCGDAGSSETIVIVALFAPIEVGWKRIGSSMAEPQHSSIGYVVTEGTMNSGESLVIDVISSSQPLLFSIVNSRSAKWPTQT